MIFGGGPYKRTTTVNYVCALSKLMRYLVQTTGTDIRPFIERIVDQFESDPALCASLKVRTPGERQMRQVDIRPAPGHPEVLFKVFMSWHWQKNAWFVMVELPSEQVFEQGEQNY